MKLINLMKYFSFFLIFNSFLLANGFDNKSEDYHPLIVTSKIGDMDLQTQKILLDLFSEATNTGFLRGMAREYYGKGQGFSKDKSKTYLASWFGIQKSIDAEFETRYNKIQHQIIKPVRGKNSLKFDSFWTRDNFNSPLFNEFSQSSADIASVINLFNLSEVLGVDLNSHFAFKLGNNALKTQLISEEQAGSLENLYATVGQTYRDFARKYPDSWQPIHASAEQSIASDGGLTVSFILLLKPVGFEQQNEINPENNHTITKVRFDPLLNQNYNIGMQVRFSRTYGGSKPTAPTLNIKFGMFTESIILLVACDPRICLRHRYQFPTFDVKVHGSKVNSFAARVLGVDEFQFVINDIRINLDSMKVMEEGTSLAIITKDRKVIDTFNSGGSFFEKIIRSNVGNSLRGGLDDEIKAAEDKFEKSILDFVGRISGLWSSEN